MAPPIVRLLARSTVRPRAIRRISTSPLRCASSGKITKLSSSLLPKTKLGPDGNPVQPLPAWTDQGVSADNRPSAANNNTANSRPKRERKLSSVGSDAVASAQPIASGLIPFKAKHDVGEYSLSPDEEADEISKAIEANVIPDSPLAREIYANWLRFPDCILLTRVGKFYESYYEPARELSAILNIKLASKRYSEGREYPFAGFPVAALDKYLKILVQDLGHTVVLVEEYDEEGSIATVGKKLTAPVGQKERKVFRVVTPGTMIDEGWLNGEESRYLLSIAIGNTVESAMDDEGESTLTLSLAYTDPSTGEFFTKETTLSQMEDELARIAPREVVLDRSLRSEWLSSSTAQAEPVEASRISNLFNLLQVLGVHVSFADPIRPPTLWGTADPPEETGSPFDTAEGTAISLLRHHLQYALRESTPTLYQPSQQSNTDQMQIDAATLQALEIRHALRPGGLVAIGERQHASPLSSRGTLLSVISKTVTQSGHRLLIRTLTAPSTSLAIINSRLSLVHSFVDCEELREELRDSLRSISDVMRSIQRFKSQRGDGRDIWDVGRWIRSVQRILARIDEELRYEESLGLTNSTGSEGIERLRQLIEGFESLEPLAETIERSIDEVAVMHGLGSDETEEELEGLAAAGEAMEAGTSDNKTIPAKESRETKKERDERLKQEREERQWWIYPSFSKELQSLHDELDSLQAQKQKLQIDLIKRFGTPSLTLCKGMRYGYHIQMSKSDGVKVTKARSLESIGATSGKTAYFAFGQWSALGAQTEVAIETLSMAQRRASRELRNIIIDQAEAIRKNADLVDEIDLALSFAQNAVEMGWVRPELDESTNLHIVDGRHPSIETSLLHASRTFTPNSTSMDTTSHLHIITGPNQGGKSTLLRQTAVITILAQSGSFVPASYAKLGIVDKVFSRVGARDDLWRDRSTFMLEMVETAAILKHATNRSLVIMDEIGRGTTLQAGVSIAYATLDHILRHVKCRTLFATHYHELGRMLGCESDRVSETTAGRIAENDSFKNGREGVSFWCTDVDEVDGAFSYSYKLRPGINHDSHAIKAARLAGMPETFLVTAEKTLSNLQQTGRFDPPPES
ncbi:hypothetical protein I317_06902 [Kwoniella heveanensis CBS 569]|nr:hypothetical protein I317_06902 [Kwoniella heveanensis CBS 569]